MWQAFRRAAGVGLWLTWVCVRALAGEPPATLNPGQAVELPGLGVSLRPPAGFVQTPLTDPVAWVYEVKATNERFEAFLPAELWRHDQLSARFRSEVGEILVGRLRYLPPENLPLVGEHVRAPDYQAAVARLHAEWNEVTVKAWVAAFSGALPVVVETPDLQVALPYCRFTFENVAPAVRQGCLLVPLPGEQLFVLFLWAPELPPADVERAVEDVIRSVTVLAGGAKPAEGGVPPKPSAEPVVVTRQQVIDSLANLKGWWHAETDHYVVKSNLDPHDRKLVERLLGEVEVMRAVYERLIPPVKPIAEVSVVTVFRSREEYLRYVPADRQWTNGLWQPDRRELVISPVDVDNRRLEADLLLGVLHHEAFHQYLHYALDLKPTPPWFNEGHAIVFEPTLIDPDRDRLELPENRLRTARLLELLKAGPPDLGRLLDLSLPEFYEPQTVQDNYTLAYGLVYFLRRAAYQYPRQGYERICPAVVQSLKKTGDWQQATAAALRGVDLNGLTRDLYQFWWSPTQRREAESRPLFENGRR